jgi:AraC-like DNA-binding protein
LKLQEMNEVNPFIDYFVERKCLSAWALPRSTIPFHDLSHVVSGESVYWVNDKPYPLKKGDMIYIPYGSVREAHTSEHAPMHCYAFNFQLYAPSGKDRELPFPTVSHIPDDNVLLNLYRSYNGCWLEKSEGHMLQCRALFMMILYQIFKYTAKGGTDLSDPRLVKIREHVLSHYHEKMDVRHLADITSLHPVYFGAWFQKNTGCTAKEYINRIRINKARDLLSTGGCTVSEAAYRCGFEDAFYFSKVFKRLTGVSPSEVIR